MATREVPKATILSARRTASSPSIESRARLDKRRDRKQTTLESADACNLDVET